MSATRKNQAALIVDVLEKWLGAAEQGRRVVIEYGPSGWSATLDERRVCRGGDLVDVLAQLATVAGSLLEGEG